jgi:hypothetical protein
MATRLGELALEEAAREAAGNWRHFRCFVWDRDDLPDADDRAIIYTHNRDSGLLDRSNASFINKSLRPFAEGDDPDVVFESHSHWAVGHVDGASIRVYRGGEITDAFRAYHHLAEQMDGYPILDESDYSEREYEATIENITDVARRLRDEYDLPDGWEGDVYSWLGDHRQRAVENRDDRGGYPEELDLRAAFKALANELA